VVCSSRAGGESHAHTSGGKADGRQRYPYSGKTYKEHADNLDKEVSIIRDLILYGFATKRNIGGDDKTGIDRLLR
jgi:hypothetical protein